MSEFPISAYSACNGLGRDTRSVLEALFAGRSGLSPLPEGLGPAGVGGVVRGELPAVPHAFRHHDSRYLGLCLLGLAELEAPVRRAVERWGARRVALCLATSTGGVGETTAAYAAWLRTGGVPPGFSMQHRHAIDSLLPVVRAITGIEGPALVVSTACSSSAKVFATARRWLHAGVVDAVLAGGIDPLCAMTVRGFASLGVLSSAPCRPFSRERAGINLGEGAALALVERRGEGPAVLLGVGESSDAHHMTQPHPEGLGARMAMERALAQGGIEAGEVDHVNAHATGTQQNDAAEGRALHELFGASTPIVATKGFTGHLLGAAGATELVFSIAALERGLLPPSLGSDPLDEALGLAVTRAATPLRSRRVLSNSLAFGGSNVSVLIGGPP
jgi:3-oxoacyl-[acyl-carrier-protein] synthase-1